MLGQPAWQEVLGVSTATDLEQVYDTITQWERLPNRVIELAVHDGLKEGDKRERRPAGQQPAVQTESSEFIGASGMLKLLKKQLRPWLKELDRQDPRQPDHRPRVYRTRSLLLADVLRWMLGLTSTEELRRKLKQHPHLAGAVNFTPGAIPSKATFSRRRLVVPLDDLKAILQALVVVLVRGKVIDGRAWVVDLTRVPTHSSVSKTYAESANGKSDPQATFCGYPDNDGGLQFGYCLVWIVDFKSELPLALVFGAGNAQDSPLALPLLRQACTQQPTLASAVSTSSATAATIQSTSSSLPCTDCGPSLPSPRTLAAPLTPPLTWPPMPIVSCDEVLSGIRRCSIAAPVSSGPTVGSN